MIQKLALSLIFFFLAVTGYSFFSYSLTDPNLVITPWHPYWQFQQFMWQAFFHNRLLLSVSYAGLITILILSYVAVVRQANQLSTKMLILLFVVITAPLLFSYNALSHDVFNYMFNAKMVTLYQANPHQQVALDFPNDDWVRFMHNTHTPAPYGYGWTSLSLLPYGLGMGKFITTWLAFRGFAIISIGMLWLAITKTAQYLKMSLSNRQLAILFFNPLLILEVISNMHNDLWMIAPAMISLGLISQQQTRGFWRLVLLSGSLLAISVSIKLATIVLVPIWIVLLINQTSWKDKLGLRAKQVGMIIAIFWPALASLALFVPLLTERSKQFLPWYLLWVMAWWPLMQAVKKYPRLSYWQTIWKRVIIILSLVVLFRYMPWLWQGDFFGPVEYHQKLIVWLPFVLALVGVPIYEKLNK
jgi:hypothetical protein